MLINNIGNKITQTEHDGTEYINLFQLNRMECNG